MDSRNITYDCENLKEIIHLNIKAEEEAILGYKNILKYSTNMYLRRIYERIVLDETTHLEIFKSIATNFKLKNNS